MVIKKRSWQYLANLGLSTIPADWDTNSHQLQLTLEKIYDCVNIQSLEEVKLTEAYYSDRGQSKSTRVVRHNANADYYHTVIFIVL